MNSVAKLLGVACDEVTAMLPAVRALAPSLEALGEAMFQTWNAHGKVLFAGNGGSCADAMHFAEELMVRFQKNRRALGAIALADPTVVTCCGNDFGYDRIFSRQVEALGNPADLLVVLTTSGNSPNCILAVEAAKRIGMKTAAFLGKDGGKLRGVCDIELLVPHPVTARVQEAHKLLFHTLCGWIDERVD